MKKTDTTIEAQGVSKHYAGTPHSTGLNGFDLEVKSGTVCGLLGPNGAGKTTAVRILSTLLDFDSGHARVAGFDVATQARQVRQRIGVVGQHATVDEVLTGRQNLVMFGQLHHLSAAAARQRADALLDQFSLVEAGNRPARTYSGGMRRRLDLAASFIVSPTVLFVDEPTTGLDPAARQEVWAVLRSLVDLGTTVLLTTQYLEEADHLADRVTLLKAGRAIAEGTPRDLKRAIGPDWLDIVFACAADQAAATAIATHVASGDLVVDGPTNRISMPVTARAKALVEVVSRLQAAQIEPQDITLRHPTLDEVFLHMTAETAPQMEASV